MSSKDTNVADARTKKAAAAAELTAASAVLAKSFQDFRRFNRAQEASIQAARRATELGA